MSNISMYWLIASLGVLSVVLFGSLLLSLRGFRKAQHELDRNQQKQLNMLNSGMVAMGERLLELEQRLASLRKQQSDPVSDSDEYSYSRARALLDQGLAIEAVAATCGLNESEVKLMGLMRGKSTQQSTPEFQSSTV